jgi:hypothetical protein
MESIVEVFTEMVNENVINICHIHLDDMSDEVPFEVVYILDHQTWEDYKDFNVDARGVPLRYKIIVKSG